MANSTVDGSVVIGVDMNVSQAEKRLGKLRGDIKKTEKEIADATAARDEARQKSVFQAAELDAEKAKLQEIKDRLSDIRAMSKDKSINIDAREEYKAQIPAVQQELNDQQARVRMLQTEWNKTENSVDRYSREIEAATKKLDEQKTAAGVLTQEIDEAVRKQNGFAKTSAAASKAMGRLGKRILGLAASALVFNVISRGLVSLQQLTMKYIKTNDEARQAIAQMKGALLTLAQPLIEVIIPVFTAFVNILTKIITAVAQFVSMLFGKTLKQSKDGAKALYKEADAIGAVGEAADEAAGSLAGFDEINQINTEDAGGAGGGAGAVEDIAPDFSWADDMGGMLDRLKEIADLVGLIAAGLALWKIGSMLPGILGEIAQLLGGILMTVGGLLIFWHGLTDAWENGVDWLNLIEMIGGLAAAVFGLYTLFGRTGAAIGLLVGGVAMFITGLKDAWENGVNWENLIATVTGFSAAIAMLYMLFGPVVAGIGSIAGGLAMLVTGFRDAMDNGWNLQNLLLSIAGILAAGLGISFIAGSWIPLLIAGIASVLLALTVATGHGEELLNGIRAVIEGFRDFFVGVFTGDIEKAVGGISKIFEGLETAVGAVISGIQDFFTAFFDWLDEKTNGRFHDILELAKGFVIGVFETVRTAVGNFADAFEEILTGIVEFFAGVFTFDFDRAAQGLIKIFDGLRGLLATPFVAAINLIIDALNLLISGLNKIKFDFPDWVPGLGGKSFGVNLPSIPKLQIPRLARGAVIPPNREFMAVLGDQSHGNNLEAPEELIRKIVREESGGGDRQVVVLLQALLEAVKAGQVIMVDKAVLGRTARDGINDITMKSGKFALLF